MSSRVRSRLRAGGSRAALSLVIAAPLGVAVTAAASQCAVAGSYALSDPLYATLVPELRFGPDVETVYVEADVAAIEGDAVYSALGYLKIGNRAVITQTGDFAGVFLRYDGAVVNETVGLVSGVVDGVKVHGVGTVANRGLIEATGTAGAGVTLGSGTITNESSGTILGALYGIQAVTSLTLTNAGEILGGAVAVHAQGSLALTNSGSIASELGVSALILGQGTVSNLHGGMIAGGQFGVYSSSGLAVTLENGGGIHGVKDGVQIAGSLTLTNSGKISSAAGSGARFLAGGSLVNGAGATIEGAIKGAVSEGLLLTVENSGTIAGGYSALYATGNLELNNSGSILGQQASGVALAGGSVVNEPDGSIAGYFAGIYGKGADSVRVENRGAITGGFGILGKLLSVTNSGRILSTEGTGVAGLEGTVENRGVIQGATYAILLGAGDSSLVLDRGSVLYGAAVAGGGYEAGLVEGGEGFDSLTLKSTGSEDAAFRGFEVLTVESGADWSLSAFNSSFSQSVRVDGNLALEGGALVLPFGSALSGSGRVASNLGVTFESGSFLAQRVGDGAAELLTVEGGVVTVETGAKVALTVQGLVEAGESFKILTSAEGIEGTFDAVEDDSERLEFSVATEGNSVIVTVEKDALVTFAATPNQQALTALLAEAEAAGGKGLQEVIAAIDASAELGATLDQLSGDFHASRVSSGLVSAQSFLTGVIGRVGASGSGGQVAGLGQVASLTQVAAGPLPSGPGAGFAAWAALEGTFGTLEDENAGDTDYDSFGGTVGGDFAALPNLFLGAAVGFAVGSSETADRGATADSTVVRLAGYGRWFSGPISVTGALGASFGSLESERATPLGLATGETDATAFGFAAEGRYALALGGFTVSPLAGVSFTTLTQDAFEETGAGAASLAVGEATADSFRANLGAVASKAIKSGGAKLTPEARLLYRHEFADGFGEVSNSFLADATATSFTVIGAEPAADVVEVGAGVTAELANGMSLFGDLGFSLGDGQTETNVAAGLRMSF